MKQDAGEDVDKSKWPGGEDPEPPLESVSQTEKDTGVSNLPNFFPYDNRRMFEAGPSGHYARQNSTESSVSYLSKDLSNTELTSKHKAIRRMNSDSLTPSLGISQNEDKEKSMLAPESNEFKSKDNHYVGIRKRISNILKKLMGRYSGMDLTREETEAEEEATQALLRQLDEARRLIGEMEKKNRYKSNKRVNTFPKEEDTEKYVLSLDKTSLIEDKTEEPQSAKLLPRSLQIQDEQSNNITHVDSSESSQETELTRDVDTFSDFASKPKDKMDDSISSMDKSETKDKPPVVNELEEPEKQITLDIDETNNSEFDKEVEEPSYPVALKATSYIAEAPDWMTEVIKENDADIEAPSDNQYKQDHEEDANGQNNVDKPVSSETETNIFKNTQNATSSTIQITHETDADIEPLPISAPVHDEDVAGKEKSNDKPSTNQDKLQISTVTDLKSLDQGLGSKTVQDKLEVYSQTNIPEMEDADIEMIPTIIESQYKISKQQSQVIKIETILDVHEEELKSVSGSSSELPVIDNNANEQKKTYLLLDSTNVISSEVDEDTRISSITNIAKDDERAEIPSTSKDTPLSTPKLRKPFVPIRYDEEEASPSKTESQNKDQDTEGTPTSETKDTNDSGNNQSSSNPKDKDSKNEPKT